MARIRAGNTLASQYAPPFSVSDGIASGWQLRWNDRLKAFEAYDPDALKKDAGFDSIQAKLYVASGTADKFVVPWAITTDEDGVANKASIIITINGVKQQQSSYYIVTMAEMSTTIGLAEAPAAGDVVEILGLQANNSADITVATFTGDVGPQFVLNWLAPSKESLIVTINGIKQNIDAYDIPTNNNYIGQSISVLTLLPQFLILDPNNPPDPNNPNLTYTLTSQDIIEVVGILDTNEIPPSPVNGTNLGAGAVFGLFKQVDTAGIKQVLQFKSLAAGAGVTITENVGEEFYTVTANLPTYTNIGSGQGLVVNPSATEIEFRTINGDQDQITATVENSSIVIRYRNPYNFTGTDSANLAAIDPLPRIFGIKNTGAPVTILLPLVSEVAPGRMITFKDETGGASPGTPITIQAQGLSTIDGVTTYIINAPHGFVTLYTDGANFFIVAEG